MIFITSAIFVRFARRTESRWSTFDHTVVMLTESLIGIISFWFVSTVTLLKIVLNLAI